MGISQTKASYVLIAEKLAARIAAVPNVGKVHSYQRHVNDPEQRHALFKDTANERLSVWMISRSSFGDQQYASTANEINSEYIIRGYMAVDDDRQSEHIFQKLIDAISDVFRPQDDLDGVVELTGPIQVSAIGYVDWAGVFVHSAELRLTVREFLIP